MAMNGTHYPQTLAKNELNNKDFLQQQGEFDNHKSLTSFSSYYPYLFDGLSYLLSNTQCIEGKHKNYLNPGEPDVDIIENKNDKNQLFYKTMMPIETFYVMCLGENNLDQRTDLLQQVLKYADESKLKTIFYWREDGSLVIDRTQPIRISFQYVTGRTLSLKELQYKKNFTKEDGTPNNPIAYVTIEYHKGWFQDLLHPNIDENNPARIKSYGWRYFRTAPHFQANLKATIREIVNSNFFDTYKDGKLSKVNAPLMAHDARELYLFLLERNNDTSDFMEFSTLELCKRCDGFGRYINRHMTKEGVVIESVPRSRGFELRAKVEKIIVTMKRMAIFGNMDGSILLPNELDERRVQLTAYDTIRIHIIRPDKYLHYDPKQIQQL